MSNEYENYLASLPSYQRKFLEHGFPSLTRAEKNQFNEWRESRDHLAVPLVIASPVLSLVATALHWASLAQVNPMVKKYRGMAKRELGKDFESFLAALPKAKAGRPPNVDLAERIRALSDAGKTAPQMQAIFKAEGQHFSREKIESYLKTRRKSLK